MDKWVLIAIIIFILWIIGRTASMTKKNNMSVIVIDKSALLKHEESENLFDYNL